MAIIGGLWSFFIGFFSIFLAQLKFQSEIVGFTGKSCASSQSYKFSGNSARKKSQLHFIDFLTFFNRNPVKMYGFKVAKIQGCPPPPPHRQSQWLQCWHRRSSLGLVGPDLGHPGLGVEPLLGHLDPKWATFPARRWFLHQRWCSWSNHDSCHRPSANRNPAVGAAPAR